MALHILVSLEQKGKRFFSHKVVKCLVLKFKILGVINQISLGPRLESRCTLYQIRWLFCYFCYSNLIVLN